MKPLPRWSAILTWMFAIYPYAVAGGPLNNSRSCQTNRCASPFVEPDGEAQKLAIMIGTEPQVAKGADPQWCDFMPTGKIAEESLGGAESAVYVTNAESLLNVPMSLGRRRKTRKHKRSSGGPGDVDLDQPPASPEAINESQIKRAAGEVEQGGTTGSKSSYVAVTPEEVELVLSPEDAAKYQRLQDKVREWRKLHNRTKAAEKWGIRPTPQLEEQLKYGKDMRNELERMKHAIQRELIRLGKARPVVLERVQRHRKSNDKNSLPNELGGAGQRVTGEAYANGDRIEYLDTKRANRGLTQEEQQELDILQAKREDKNAKLRAKRRMASARIKDLEAKKANQGLTQEEQQELDSRLAKRLNWNAKQKARQKTDRDRDSARMKELKAKMAGSGLTQEEQQELDTLQTKRDKRNAKQRAIWERGTARIKDLRKKRASQVLTQEEQQELNSLQAKRDEWNTKRSAERREVSARMKELKTKMAGPGLTPEEQQELDALQANRDKTYAYRRRKSGKGDDEVNKPPSDVIPGFDPSGVGSRPPENSPSNILELIIGQQPGTMDTSKVQTHSPTANRQPDQWHSNPMPFIQNKLSILGNTLSRIAHRFNGFSGAATTPGIRTSAPPPAPRVFF